MLGSVVAQHLRRRRADVADAGCQRRDRPRRCRCGVTETFTFPSVPPGTYTFSVRAVNAAGISGAVESGDADVPDQLLRERREAPVNFVASRRRETHLARRGSRPRAAPRPLSYIVNVTRRIQWQLCRRPRARIASPVRAGHI